VPWCEGCSKFWTPTALEADGRCPSCGRQVAEPPAEPVEVADAKVPWHFKLLLVGICGYLGWRLVQLVQWLL
jgi:uncharacterized protein with PIN domain